MDNENEDVSKLSAEAIAQKVYDSEYIQSLLNDCTFEEDEGVWVAADQVFDRAMAKVNELLGGDIDEVKGPEFADACRTEMYEAIMAGLT